MKQLIYIILMLMFAIGCGQNSQVTMPDRNHNDTSLIFENPEAMGAALWLSGDLVAPPDLYADLDFGFTSVRAEHGDSIPELNAMRFFEPWVPGEVVCELTFESVQDIRDGEYTDLDSLNTLYGFTAMDTSMFFYGFWWVRLSLNEMYHPERLAEFYITVSSVIDAKPNGQHNNYYNVYPWCIGGGTSYLFRQGSVDCPSGCIYNHFWYFWVIGNTVELVGTWDTSIDPYPPEWWTYGQIAYYYYEEGYLPEVTGIKN